MMGCSTTLVKLAWCYFFLLTVSNLMTVTVNLPATVEGLGEKKKYAVILLISAHCWNLNSKIASAGKQAKSKGQ